MKKFLGVLIALYCKFNCLSVHAAEKFDVIPDLPEYLSNSAQASSISTVENSNALVQQSVGNEPNLVSIFFSLIFVILLIYATGIIYNKLNKLGFNTLKRQMGENSASKVAVLSTTALGGNKTLHVVELDGKRMLIGASQASIHLIKDLGTYNENNEIEDGEYSKIEIPNIRIPKIEIPKIEFPGFTRVLSKANKFVEEQEEEFNTQVENSETEEFEISDISVVNDNPDQIIDNLFKDEIKDESSTIDNSEINEEVNEHKVDPDEYLLYKKYLV